MRGDGEGAAPDIRPTSLPLLIAEKIPMLIMVALLAAFTYQSQKSAILDYPFPVRLANVPLHYAAYIGKTFWPFNLSILYLSDKNYPPAWKLAGSLLLLGALTLAALANWRRRPYLIAGWLWFLGVLVPMAGFVQSYVQAIADRYTYISQTGLIIALVWGLGEFAGRLGPPKRIAAVAGCVLLLITARTAHQLAYWKDDVTLWGHAIEIPPVNDYTYNMLTFGYEMRGDLENALKYAKLAEQANPTYHGHHSSVGEIYYRMENYPAAIAEFNQALELDPQDDNSLVLLGEILNIQNDPEGAFALFKKAAAVKPDDPRINDNIGYYYSMKQDWARAIEYYNRAIQSDPYHPLAYVNMGILEKKRGDTARSMEFMQKAVEIEPNDPETHMYLGDLWRDKNDSARAKQEYQRALDLARTAGNQRIADMASKRLSP